MTPRKLHRALHRVAGDAESTYTALLHALRSCEAVAADETGWRINGDYSWLGAYVGGAPMENIQCNDWGHARTGYPLSFPSLTSHKNARR